MSTELVIICGRCGSHIEGDTGFLGVRHRLISDGMALAVRGHAGPDISWEALHDSCNPDPGDDCYQIDAITANSHAALARWSAHLMSKRWLELTDWDEVLREAIGEGGPTPRIAPRQLRVVA